MQGLASEFGMESADAILHGAGCRSQPMRRRFAATVCCTESRKTARGGTAQTVCLVGSSPHVIARCRVEIDALPEDRLLRRLFRAGLPAAAETVVAYAIAPSTLQGAR